MPRNRYRGGPGAGDRTGEAWPRPWRRRPGATTGSGGAVRPRKTSRAAMTCRWYTRPGSTATAVTIAAAVSTPAPVSEAVAMIVAGAADAVTRSAVVTSYCPRWRAAADQATGDRPERQERPGLATRQPVGGAEFRHGPAAAADQATGDRSGGDDDTGDDETRAWGGGVSESAPAGRRRWTRPLADTAPGTVPAAVRVPAPVMRGDAEGYRPAGVAAPQGPAGPRVTAVENRCRDLDADRDRRVDDHLRSGWSGHSGGRGKPA